jgi:hypothetical protein
MFAKRRILKVGNASSVRTPILLPSFSSKGFPNVAEILEAMEEYISDEVLVSAYDLHYKELELGFDFASLIFLDSGGYEASKDAELSETFDKEHVAKAWTPEMYAEVVSSWSSLSPTIFVSFDHPKHRCNIFDQVERAKAMSLPASAAHYAKSLLIKPESADAKRVHLEKVTPAISKMTDFAVIGVTEKEIGNSMLDRMVNVARLRQELSRRSTYFNVSGITIRAPSLALIRIPVVETPLTSAFGRFCCKSRLRLMGCQSILLRTAGIDPPALSLRNSCATQCTEHERVVVVQPAMQVAAGSERWRPLILGTSRAAQSEPTELQDALEVCEPHLDLLALMPGSLEVLGTSEGTRNIPSGFVLITWNLAEGDLRTALRSEFAAVAVAFSSQVDQRGPTIHKRPSRRQGRARGTVVDIASRIIAEVAAREGALISL